MEGFAKFARQAAITGKGRALTQAASFDFTILPLTFELADGVSLGGDSFALFDGGIGAEVSYIVDLTPSGDMEKVAVNLMGGGEAAVFGAERNIDYNTRIIFPYWYEDILRSSDTGLSGLVGGKRSIRFGPGAMSSDVLTAMDEVLESSEDASLRITTTECRGQGFDLGLGIDLDAALGVGVGLSLGINGKYYDEIEYPRKSTDVFHGRKNYLLTSSEYTSTMEEAEFKDILTELFSGTIPLISDALVNLMNVVENVVEAGKQKVVEAVSETEKKVGEVAGKVEQAGKWVISIFSPSTPRVVLKSSGESVVRQMYYSTYVLHRRPGAFKEAAYEAVETVMIVVSDAMNIGFVPEGDSESLDTLDDPVTLKMVIDEDKLVENGFTADDKDRVQIYYYDDGLLNWILEGGTCDADTVSVDITQMGTYALGIELTTTTDETPPEIQDIGPSGTIRTAIPELYVLAQDDRFGEGINLSETDMYLNDTLLGSLYDPGSGKIFYQVPLPEGLSDGDYEFRVVVRDFSGNETTETCVFTVDAPEPPSGIAVSDVPDDNGHRVSISWSLSPDDAIITSYNIYRSRSSKLTEPLVLDSFNSLEELTNADENSTILIATVPGGRTSFEDPYVPLNNVIYYYWLQAVTETGSSKIVQADFTTETGSRPLRYNVSAPYPNPFNPYTTIRYELPEDSYIELVIYDVTGRKVKVLEDGMAAAGIHEAVWDGRNENKALMGSGVFIYEFKAGGYRTHGKLMMIK